MTRKQPDHITANNSPEDDPNNNAVGFLANVSHEIRNPLNAIIGISGLLKHSTSEEDRRKYIDILLETSEGLLELTNNIMDFSKLQSGKLQPESNEVDLRELVRKNLYRHGAIAESKGLDLVFQADDNLPPLVMTDTVKLNQVFTNLISNAIKFTASGSISVILNVVGLEGTHVSVQCIVKDTGIGIPQEKINTIFNPFDQGDANINVTYGGTGLGLTISRHIINILGSDLQVKSYKGRGSEFSFMLKLKINNDNKLLPSKMEEISKENLPEDLKVLVVDDNKVNVLVVRKHLELWGIHCEIAQNGLKAVRKVQQEQFDLVLMDLHLPEMDGMEATYIITDMMKTKNFQLPIIALTASTEFYYHEDAKTAGFIDFLIKPFAPKELLKKIISHTRDKVCVSDLLEID